MQKRSSISALDENKLMDIQNKLTIIFRKIFGCRIPAEWLYESTGFTF